MILNNSCPVTIDYGQIAFCCYYFLGITVVRGELTMISFPIVFFLPLTFLLLRSRQQYSIPSIYHFLHSSPTLSGSLLMHRNFGFSRLHFLSTFWTFALCQFSISRFVYMTTSRTPHQFLLTHNWLRCLIGGTDRELTGRWHDFQWIFQPTALMG